jgi:hypothetical protein
MVPKLDFGRITGLRLALWQFDIEKYFQLLMSMGVPLERLGIAQI